MKQDRGSTSSRARPISLLVNLKRQLQFYLDKREMNASQLARKAGVPKQSIGGWLAGSNPRDVRQLKRVADVLGTTVDDLVFGDGENVSAAKSESLEALLAGDGWLSGVFEIRVRRIRRDGK